MNRELKKLTEEHQHVATQLSLLRAEGIERVRALMAEYGLSVRDLVDQPLYRSPLPPAYADAAGNTWTGIGRRPAWVKRVLEAGLDLNDYRVRGPKG